MPTVPPADIDKITKFQAAYTSKTFNDNKKAIAQADGVLFGMDVSESSPTTVDVATGLFLQEGLAVELKNPFTITKPGVAFPWTCYAYSDDEVVTSPVTLAIIDTASLPAGVVPLATSVDGVTWVNVPKISLKALSDRIIAIEGDLANLKLEDLIDVSATLSQGVRDPLAVRNVVPDQTDPLLGKRDVFDALGLSNSIRTQLTDAIRDPSALRAAVANAANPLATLADVAVSPGDLLAVPAIVKIDGDFTTNSATPVVVTGTGITFTMASGGRVYVGYAGSIYRGSTQVIHRAYIKVDASYYQIHTWSGNVTEVGIGGVAVFAMAPGSHTFSFAVDRHTESSVTVRANGTNPFYFCVWRQP